jgi:transketolase
VFAAGRTDQITWVSACEAERQIVGSSAGLSDYGDGSSHQTVDDVAIMRVLPNQTVLVPADANEVRRMVYAAVSTTGRSYPDHPQRPARCHRREQAFVIGRPG